MSVTRPLGGFPLETFARRTRRILRELGRGAMVLPAAPIRFRSRDSEYPYRPDSELFYATGAVETGSVAVLRGHGEDAPFVLFVRERDPKAELWSGRRLGVDGARETFHADEVHPLGELEARLPGLLEGSDRVYCRLGADERVDRLVLGALASARARGPRKGVGPRGVLDPGEILDEMRLVKDEEEVDRIREAARVTVEGFRTLLAGARPGMGEWELEALLNGTFRRLGASGPGFETIVGSGANACVLHYVTNADRIADGALVLVDAGAEVGLYSGDVTRTFPAGGRFTAGQRAVYEVVEAARAAGVAAVSPGATTDDVHRAVVHVLTEGLVDLGAVDGPVDDALAEARYKAFFPHQTSHWLGLDVHDPGDYAREGAPRRIEPGMVLTVEPGLYFPAAHDGTPRALAGTGVRIEDDVLVTPDGRENLTAALPTDPDAVASRVGTAGAAEWEEPVETARTE